MKKIMALLMVMALVLCTIACSTAPQDAVEPPEESAPAENTAQPEPDAEEPEDASSSQAPADEDLFIGIVTQDQTLPMGIAVYSALEAYAAKNYSNIRYTLVDGQGDAVYQCEQVESLVSQGADVIILNAADAVICTAVVKDTISKGVPVVTVGAVLSENVGQYWCGSPNEAAGEMQMNWVIEQVGDTANIAIIRGPLGHEAEIGRYQGYENVLKDYPNINIVYDQTAEWDRSRAMSLVETWLQNNTDMQVIVAQNDDMALGALSAVEQAGKKEDILVIGCDMIDDAAEAVIAERLDATLYQDAVGQGEGAFEMAVQLARGNDVEDRSIPFLLITPENVQEWYSK